MTADAVVADSMIDLALSGVDRGLISGDEHHRLYVSTLRRICDAANATIVVEIGIGQGVSARTFAASMMKRGGGTLVSVDIERDRPNNEARNDVRACGVYWDVRHGDSLEVTLPDIQCDLLYIDADHAGDYAYKEFKRYEPMVRSGGYIIFDDYPAYVAVYRAIHQLAEEGWHGLFIPYDDAEHNSNGHVIYRKPGNIPLPVRDRSE